MSAIHVEKVAIVRPLNTHLSSGRVTLLAGNVQTVMVEVDGTTSNAFSEYASASPPVAIDNFLSSMGHLLDAFVFCALDGIELWIDESIHAPGVTPPWHRAAQYVITANVPQPLRGFRIAGSFVKISIVNTAAASRDVFWHAKVRSS